MLNEIVFETAIGFVVIVGALVAFARGWLKPDKQAAKGDDFRRNRIAFASVAIFFICVFLSSAAAFQNSAVVIAGSGLLAIGLIIGFGKRLQSKHR
jgi:hypothetical protein